MTNDAFADARVAPTVGGPSPQIARLLQGFRVYRVYGVGFRVYGEVAHGKLYCETRNQYFSSSRVLKVSVEVAASGKRDLPGSHAQKAGCTQLVMACLPFSLLNPFIS